MEECKCINSQEFRDLKDKVNDHEKRISKVESDKALREYQHSQVMDILNELKIDVKEMKEKPSKRWDLIIASGITGVITFFISKYFK